MSEQARYAGEDGLMMLFDKLTGGDRSLLDAMVPDAGDALSEARETLQAMLPEIAYIDEPANPMAGSMYFCAFVLALYLPLQKRGVDVHDYGSAMLKMIKAGRQPEPAPSSVPHSLAKAAEHSQQNARAGEFVFEVFEGQDDATDWGMNIKSCAICSLYSKHNCMNLVPYMCASDDIASDISGQGLRRTGTIALGAHQCDFRFKTGGEGKHLSGQYPDRIKLMD